MGAKRYKIEIVGETPLLMHQDNIDFTDQLTVWRSDPLNKGKTKAGDDRFPAWVWIGYLYHDANTICMPSDNLMTMFREGGAKCLTGKGSKSFKTQTQTGITVDQCDWPILVNGKTVSFNPVKELIGNFNFEEHQAHAVENGFELFVKRAKLNNAKHVRVRPRFDNWSCSGSVTITDDTITKKVLDTILFYAGANCGLCDWRPSSPRSPGPWGKFTATSTLMK